MIAKYEAEAKRKGVILVPQCVPAALAACLLASQLRKNRACALVEADPGAMRVRAGTFVLTVKGRLPPTPSPLPGAASTQCPVTLGRFLWRSTRERPSESAFLVWNRSSPCGVEARREAPWLGGRPDRTLRLLCVCGRVCVLCGVRKSESAFRVKGMRVWLSVAPPYPPSPSCVLA
jgi:hypothetical protein